MKWFYMLIVVCLGILFFSNPDMNDFRSYVKEESRRMIQESAAAPGLGDVLANAGSELAESFVDNVTRRENYYLFSTYEINLTPRSASSKPFKFLGIGGSFINLSKFDAKQR